MVDLASAAAQAEISRNMSTAMSILSGESASWAREFVLRPFVLPEVLSNGVPVEDTMQEARAPGDAAGDVAILSNSIACSSAVTVEVTDYARLRSMEPSLSGEDNSIVFANLNMSLIPAWSINSLTVGAALHRFNEMNCPVSGEKGPSAFVMGRFVRDERTAETLVIANSRRVGFEDTLPGESPNNPSSAVHIIYLRHDSSVERFHLCMVCEEAAFAAGRFAESVFLSDAADQVRPKCPTCGAHPMASCGCTLQLTAPASPLDFANLKENFLTHSGPWTGCIKYFVRDFARGCFNKSRFDARGVCVREVDDQMATLLQKMAITTSLKNTNLANAVLPNAPTLETSPQADTTTSDDSANATDNTIDDTTVAAEDLQTLDATSAHTSWQTCEAETPYSELTGKPAHQTNMWISTVGGVDGLRARAQPTELDGVVSCLQVQEPEETRPQGVCEDALAIAPDACDNLSDLLVQDVDLLLADYISASHSTDADTRAVRSEDNGTPDAETSVLAFETIDAAVQQTQPLEPNHGDAPAEALSNDPVSTRVETGVPVALRIAPYANGTTDEGMTSTADAYTGLDPAIAKRLRRQQRNREAAARSNAKRKRFMDTLKGELRQQKDRVASLRDVEKRLREENLKLKDSAAGRWKDHAKAAASATASS